MGISDLIAGFIQEALDETDGVLELQRSDLAQRFGCVPSQINYVMSTRFSPIYANPNNDDFQKPIQPCVHV